MTNRKLNLKNSTYNNLEKSVNTANNISIYYAQVNLKSQGFESWTHSDTFKQEQLKMAEIAEQNLQILSQIENQRKKDNYFKNTDLVLTNQMSSEVNTTHQGSPAPMKLKFNENIY